MQITAHQFWMITIMALTVIALRAFPFIVFGGGQRKVPALLLYLGKVLTAAAIAMLVVYSLAGICDFKHPQYSHLAFALPASAVTVFLQWFLRNPLISICCGTACYMLLLHYC